MVNLKTLQFIFVLSTILLVGCAQNDTKEEFSLIKKERFFFVTNRLYNPKKQNFINQRSEQLSYGDLNITLAQNKEKFTLAFSALHTENQLSLIEKINNSSGDVVIFIHGFNDSLEESMASLAHLKFDSIKNNFIPLSFSWASESSLLKYNVDETNVLYSMEFLRKFLIHLHNKIKNKNIHIVAHSMGNRLLLLTLKELAIMHPKHKFHFKNIILIAPDIDKEVFYRNIYKYILKISDKTTIYFSQKDKALKASQLIHKYPRLGEKVEDNCKTTSTEKFQLVDTSGLDTGFLSWVSLNHSDYLEKKHYTQDIENTILGERNINRISKKINNCTYYFLK